MALRLLGITPTRRLLHHPHSPQYPDQHMSSTSLASELAEKPIEMSIRRKIGDVLKPYHLEVINESHMHNVPKGSETHFRVLVVSEKFENLPLLKRHRLVNDLLKDELSGPVHALSIQAHTTSQWESSEKQVEESPPCRGGFGK